MKIKINRTNELKSQKLHPIDRLRMTSSTSSKISLILVLMTFVISSAKAQFGMIYDDVNRLECSNFSTFRCNIQYDPVGNRISKTVPTNGITVYAKLFLQGAFDEATGKHKNTLHQLEIVPKTEPYSSLGYSFIGGGGETVKSFVETTMRGDKEMIDWVVVEIRDSNDLTTILASKAAILQADGSVVSTDFFNPVTFSGLDDGNYYVAILHRNHLRVMTASPVLLTKIANTTPVDFSNPGTLTYGTNAQKVINGVTVMWGGNASFESGDQYVRATPQVFPPPSLASDITYILDQALGSDPNATLIGYFPEDVNMDGKVRVKPLVFPPPGVPSDATFILDNVLNSNPNLTRRSSVD